ncbi:MAG: hypothetical protein CMD30_03675 [Flavobacteriales bacterium]|nr:hypothetical protein [Flavobacteriales bacterium]
MKKKYILIVSLVISSVSFSFSQCIHTFNMFDSFGDGWNGNAVDVLVNGNTVVTGATIANGSIGFENFSANIGDTIELANWVTGSWTNEVSWDITDGDGVIIATGVHNGLALNTYGFCPTCPQPTSLGTTNLTASSATLTWISGGVETLWNIEWGVSGFTQGTGTFDTTSNFLGYPIVSLAASSTYDFYIQGICGVGDTSSWAGPFTFTTPCAAIIPPSLQDFSSGFPPNACWNQAGDGDPSTGPTGLGVSSWFQDGFGNVGTTGAVRVNLWLATANEWVLSPQYDLSSGGPFQLEFDFGIFSYSQTSPGTLGSDDRVEVLISRDGGGSWTGLTNYNNNYVTSPGGNHEIIPLPNDTGIVQFAFWATEGTVNDIEDNDVMFDNFEILPIPSCPQPQYISLLSATTDSATLTWSTFGTDSLWNIYVTPAGINPDSSHLITVNNDTVFIGGLNSSSDYDFYVQSICSAGDSSFLSGPYSFSTLCAIASAPYSQSFSVGSLPNCWSQSVISGDGWQFSGTPGYDAGNNGRPSGSYAWIDFSASDIGTVMEVVSVDVSALSVPQVEFDYFCWNSSNPSPANILYVEARNNNIWDTVGVLQINSISGWNPYSFSLVGYDSSGIVNVRFRGESGGASDDFYNDILVDNLFIREAPTCPSPLLSTVTTDSLTASSAFISWLPGLSETLWGIEWGPAGFTLGTGNSDTTSTTPFEIDSLMSNTFYDVYVQAICDSIDQSYWAGPYSFITDCLPISSPYYQNFDNTTAPNIDQCWSVLNSTNSTGAWIQTTNTTFDPQRTAPNSIEFYSSNATTGSLLLVSPYISDLDTTKRIRFYLQNNGSTFYNSDLVVGTMSDPTDANTFNLLQTIPYTVFDGTIWQEIVVNFNNYFGTDNYIALGHALTNTYDYIWMDDFHYEELPSCISPTNLGTSNLNASGADLTWFAGGTESFWNVQWGVSGFSLGSGFVDTTSNYLGFHIDSLSPTTSYDFYVQAICDSVDQSYWAGPYTFSTPCSAIVPPSLEDFSAGFPPDACWNQAGNGDPSTGPTGLGTSSWVTDGFGNVGTNGAVKVNLYTTGKNEWVLSPQYDLSSGGPYQIEFDFGVFDWPNPTPGTLGSDDRVEVLISRDGGGSWSGLTNFNNNYTTSPGGNHEIIALPNDSGIVQFAFWATEGTVDDAEDNDVMFDNFEVVPVPSCPQPQYLNVINIGTDSVTISWSSFATDSLWNIYLTPSGVSPDTSHLTVINNDTVVLSGLSSATTYDFYVQSVCAAGDSSFITGPISFTTNCTAFTAPYTQEFSQGSLPVCWSQSTITGDGWRFTGIPGYSAGNNGRPSGSYAWIDFSGVDQGTVMEVAPVDISSLLSPQIEFDFFCFNTTNPSPPNILFIEAFDGANWLTIDSIQDNTNQSWSTYSFPILGFDVSGIIYLRFRGESGGATDDFYNDILVDDLTVKEGPQNDVGIILANLPTASTGCEVDSSIVTATIFNFGYLPQSGFTIQYSLNGTPFVETVFDTLQPGDSLLYTFTLPVDLTQDGIYSFDFTTNLTNDDNTANDAYGSTIEVQNYYTPIAPTVTDDTVCVDAFNPNGQIATLIASGPAGVDIDWFDINDNYIGTGDTMQTDTINTTTSLFAAYKELAPGNMGAVNNTFGGGGYYNFFTEGLMFDVYNDLTIDSVTIYPSDTGTVGIIIQSILGSTIFNGTYTITSPVNTIFGHKVPIGVNIPAGLGYGMYISSISPGTLSLYRNTTNASYPYDYGNVASITQASNGSTDFYYFFYNWDISTISCYSDMQEAIVYVDPCTNIKENNFGEFCISPNPNNGSFEIDMTNITTSTEIEILDLNGKVIYRNTISNKNQNINIENISRGVYIVKATQNENIKTKKLIIN